MTVTCPHGHPSETEDYCDQCGARIAPVTQPTTALEPVTAEPCPACDAPRTGGERFCEACGYDFAAARAREPEPPAAAAWEAVISADREHFERVAADGMTFPEAAEPRAIALDRPEVRIGRRSDSRGIHPDLDPDDPGVSHAHAVLVRRPDGAYAIVDVGSTNGTTVNGDPEPIVVNIPVALADGDRICIGAWTAITIRAR